MGEGSSGPKPQVAARIPRHKYEQLQEYCEKRDVSQSDALRKFVDEGLNRAQIEEEFTDRMDLGVDPQSAGTLLILVLLVVFVLQNAGVL